MAALVGADLQQLRRRDPVKPRPVEMRHGLMQLAGDRRHERHRVILPVGQSIQPLPNRRVQCFLVRRHIETFAGSGPSLGIPQCQKAVMAPTLALLKRGFW